MLIAKLTLIPGDGIANFDNEGVILVTTEDSNSVPFNAVIALDAMSGKGKTTRSAVVDLVSKFKLVRSNKARGVRSDRLHDVSFSVYFEIEDKALARKARAWFGKRPDYSEARHKRLKITEGFIEFSYYFIGRLPDKKSSSAIF